MKSKPLTFLLAFTFLFFFSCSEKEPKPKIETTKQEKLNETTFSKWDVALQGLIHTFSDSGKLLKSITYHEGIILSQKEYLNPPFKTMVYEIILITHFVYVLAMYSLAVKEFQCLLPL